MGAGNSGKVLQQELELSGPQSTWSGRDKREREQQVIMMYRFSKVRGGWED